MRILDVRMFMHIWNVNIFMLIFDHIHDYVRRAYIHDTSGCWALPLGALVGPLPTERSEACWQRSDEARDCELHIIQTDARS